MWHFICDAKLCPFPGRPRGVPRCVGESRLDGRAVGMEPRSLRRPHSSPCPKLPCLEARRNVVQQVWHSIVTCVAIFYVWYDLDNFFFVTNALYAMYKESVTSAESSSICDWSISLWLFPADLLLACSDLVKDHAFKLKTLIAYLRLFYWIHLLQCQRVPSLSWPWSGRRYL